MSEYQYYEFLAIDQTRRLIDTKKRRKKSLMQQLLTGEARVRL